MRFLRHWKSVFGAVIAFGAAFAALTFAVQPASAEVDGTICKAMPPDEDATVKEACMAVLLPCMLGGSDAAAENACLRKNLPPTLRALRQSQGGNTDTHHAALRERCVDRRDADTLLSACGELIRTNDGSDPDMADYYAARSSAYYTRKRYDLALADVSESIAYNPNESLAYRVRGLVLLDRGDDQGALVSFQKAVSLDPKSAASMIELAATEHRLGQMKAGMSDMLKACKLDMTIYDGCPTIVSIGMH